MPRKPNKPCAGCGKLCYPSRHPGAPREHWCRSCRKARRCGTANGYRKGCRCDACSRAKNASLRSYAAKRREAGRPLGGGRCVERDCENCGVSFAPAHSTGRFCTRGCYVDSLKVTDLAVWGPPLIRSPSPRWHPMPQVQHPSIQGALFIYGSCAWCEEPFMAVASHWGGRPLTCSRTCQRKRSKARSGKFQPTPRQRQRIYERDKWTCQICLEPVDPEGTGDWQASLDHIIPQSHQLVPDHSDGNLRLAHMWCNSVRGDGRHCTDDDLRVA